MKQNIKKIILFVVIALVGSFITFYGTNLLFSDLSNMFYGVHDVNWISSIPFFIVCMDFILAFVYVFKFFRRPKYKKALTLKCCVILAVFSILGIVFSILTGSLIYGTLLAPYPFVAYGLISLLVHLAFLAGSIALFIVVKKKMPEDEGKRKLRFGYVLYSIFLPILVWLAFERFGAVMWAPVYLHWGSFYLTWAFYVSLLIPMAELIHIVLYSFESYKNYPKKGMIFATINFGLAVITNLVVIILGSTFPQFISAISPALALERLATMPVDTILVTVLTIGLGIYNLRYAAHVLKKGKAN